MKARQQHPNYSSTELGVYSTLCDCSTSRSAKPRGIKRVRLQEMTHAAVPPSAAGQSDHTC